MDVRDNKSFEKMHFYLENFLNSNYEKDMFESFVERHKLKSDKSKLIAGANVINAHVIMCHIDFDARIAAEETDQTKVVLKLKCTQMLLIPELLLRGESHQEVHSMN